MKCFYHSSDLDGHCSGAIVKKAYPKVELIGINYGDIFPWEDIKKNEKIFMVDFSLQPFEDMERLNSISILTWIDHHKTSIDEAYKRNFFSKGGQFLQTTKAACELTWKLFYGDMENEAVNLLGRYDVHHLIPGALELQNGLKMYDTKPENNEIWSKLLSKNTHFLDECLKTGKILFKKQKMNNIAYAKACSFETILDGLNVVAINKGLTNSQIFESVYDKQKHDAMLTFVWRNGKYTVSLYSDKDNIDVSLICKKYGGGGHKGAAGFQCAELPFMLN